MFYLETRDEDGRLNNMQIIKLKDKLGTRQLPTAELLLDGVVAHKVKPLHSVRVELRYRCAHFLNLPFPVVFFRLDQR